MLAKHPCPTPVFGRPAPPPRRPADPAAAAAVAPALLEYLQRHLRTQALRYAEAPAPIPDGWETHIYTFQLDGPGLPRAWARPLVLRVHANGRARWRGPGNEFAVHRHMIGLGYPAPRPLLLEEACDTFGGPFLVVERMPGPTLLGAMLGKPWLLFHFPSLLARTHARLHALPPDGFPAPPGPFLERHLGETRAAIARHGLRGLLPGLDWLHARRPPEPASPSILHLDFHPLNLIARADGSLGVLDWTYADRGDPHADVATTLLILDCFPAATRNPWHRLCLVVGRPVVRWCYRRAYARLRPLDEGRLAYYRAWSALRHLVRYGSWLRAGPEANGCKCSLVEHAGPGLLTTLCHYFRRWAGVEVSA